MLIDPEEFLLVIKQKKKKIQTEMNKSPTENDTILSCL
jgi:hypothetical protein